MKFEDIRREFENLSASDKEAEEKRLDALFNAESYADNSDNQMQALRELEKQVLIRQDLEEYERIKAELYSGSFEA